MLRVVTLNVGSLFEPGWNERQHEVVAWLDHLDPDVVCLQEVWRSPEHRCSIADLVDAAHTSWNWEFAGCDWSESGGSAPVEFGSAVLSRWPIDTHMLLPLPVDDDPTVDLPVWRMALELVHVRTAGLDVFSTHLAPPPAQAYHRVHQTLFIDEAIRRLSDPGAVMPPILCGDFNAEPGSDEIRFLSSLATIDGTSTYFQDAWRAAGQTGPGFTWDGRRNPLAATLHLPPKRIDYVFVGDPFGRPGGSGLVESCEVAFDEAMTGRLASDHFGLVVDVRWPDRPG